MEKTKMSFKQLQENKDWSKAVVVFKQESFRKQYTEEERSYKVSCNNKYFNGNALGNSLFGDCLDGKDSGVRLDNYIHYGDWVVDYCYVTKWKEEGI